MTTDAAAFAALQAIESGEWDRHLQTLGLAIRDREAIYDQKRVPRRVLPPGQVWTWLNDPVNRWEPRGTGVIMT